MVGKTIGSITVLSLDEAKPIILKGHKSWEYYITVKCNRCNKVFTTTWKNFRASSKNKCKACKFCKGSYMIEARTIETGLTKHERKRIAAIKAGAKNRNIEFCLTDIQVKDLLSKTCIYCGKEHADGIDRVDSLKGYTIENCVPCCQYCNRMKSDYSLEFFKNHIKQIYKTLCNDT